LHPHLSHTGWRNNTGLLGFATLSANLQTPRYRPWITASSLLLLTGDMTGGHGGMMRPLLSKVAKRDMVTDGGGGKNGTRRETGRGSTNG